MKELIEELRHLSVMGNALKDEYIAQTCSKAIAALEAAADDRQRLEGREATLAQECKELRESVRQSALSADAANVKAVYWQDQCVELKGYAKERNDLLFQVVEVIPGQSRYETALDRLASYNNRPANPPQSALPAAAMEEGK